MNGLRMSALIRWRSSRARATLNPVNRSPTVDDLIREAKSSGGSVSAERSLLAAASRASGESEWRTVLAALPDALVPSRLGAFTEEILGIAEEREEIWG